MDKRQRIILLCAMLVTFVTGSIHCFSVFLVPFETRLALPRAQVSLFYSLALIFLTVAVLFGYLVYERVKPATLIFLACAVAGAGLALSVFATNWWGVFFGYSVLFGVANGFAYGYVLQLVGRALPDFKGFAMAAVTAAYAVGSVIFSLILAKIIATTSLTISLLSMGALILLGGTVSAVGMKACGARYEMTHADTHPSAHVSPSFFLICLFWLAYGCSVFAGLILAIGHAAGMVQTLGGEYSLAIWGAVFIGIGSAIGGFFIGAVINRNNMHAWLLGLPMISAVFLGTLYFTDSPIFAIGFLSFIGFSYGAVIAVLSICDLGILWCRSGPKSLRSGFYRLGLCRTGGPVGRG